MLLAQIIFIFALMFCTMTYGWMTEALSRPEDNGDEKPMKWALRNGSPGLVIPELPAAFQRLFPHIVGYVPYSACWAVLFHSFFYNVGDGGGPPIFVYVATEPERYTINCILTRSRLLRQLLHRSRPVCGLHRFWNYPAPQPSSGERAQLVHVG